MGSAVVWAGRLVVPYGHGCAKGAQATKETGVQGSLVIHSVKIQLVTAARVGVT